MNKKQKTKSPAFQFYAKDWLSDLRVRSLSYEEKGLYIELLAMSWLEAIPNDTELLCQALHIAQPSIEKILHTFFIERDNFFYNKKLEEYREEKIKFIKSKKEAGIKGATSRWGKAKKQSIAQPWHNHSTPKDLPIANDSSSTDTSSSPYTSSNNISNEIQEIVDCFQNSFNQSVRVLSEKRKKHIKARLKVFSLEEIKLAIENFSASPFHTGENDRGWIADLDFIIRSDENIEKGLKLNEVQVKQSNRTQKTNERCILIDGMYFSERERDEILEKEAFTRDEEGYPRFKQNWIKLVSFKL